MDVYFSDQVNDPTLRLFSSTKTMGSDLDENISLKFEDDPVMATAIANATSGHLMDISDMMQETQSDKASEHNYEDLQPEVQINNHNYNNINEKQAAIQLQQQHHQQQQQQSLNKNLSGNNGNGSAGHGISQNDYDDADDMKPPMAHTPIYMPQHHNIDQVIEFQSEFATAIT